MNEPEPTSWTPREVLSHYFRELLALNGFAMAEAELASQHGRELDLDDLRARRATIRERYCTSRPRKTDRVVSYGPLETRAYDPSNIVVEREVQQSKSCVEIAVYNSALREHWRYVLILRKGRWLIDALQFRDGRKWMTVPLH